MANPNKPFKGVFGMDDEATGAETTLLSANYVSMTVTADGQTIDLGPFLSTNHRDQILGSTRVGINISLQKLTAAQIMGLATHWEAQDLMEIKYIAEAGTLDTVVATNLQTQVQFYLLNMPMPPMEQDAVYTYETGEINGQFLKLDDNSAAVSIGTETAT